MTKRVLILCMLTTLSVPVDAVAETSTILMLGNTTDNESILSIGSAPIKKKKELELGILRTREAELPGGLLTLADRMKLRAKRGLARQRAVGNARRKQPPVQNFADNRGENEILHDDSGQPVME